MTLDTDPKPQGSRRGGFGRTVLINLIVFVCLLAALEIAARVYIGWVYGTQTAGLAERTEYLSYRPFVMYGPDWDERFGKIPPPAAGVCRVMLVGGSAAAKFPPGDLEAALSAQYRGKKFEVINAAYGGYEARQETIVVAFWGARLKPDLLLSFDGGNDMEHRLRVPKAGEFYLSPTYEAMLSRPYLAPLYYLASHSQVYNAMLRLQARRAVGPFAQYADAVPVYRDAQDSMNRLARGIGAARMMVLQPFSAFKSPLSKEEAAMTLFKYREEVMKQLYDAAHAQLADLSKRDNVIYLDGRTTFQNNAEQLFVDDFHLTPEGFRQTAKAIAEKLHGAWPADCAR